MARQTKVPGHLGFNEAAGIHRRKPQERLNDEQRLAAASMRPPEFTGGNPERVVAIATVSSLQ